MIESRSSSKLVIVLTTEANLTIANCLAKALLSRKLAVCVSSREVSSTFWWQDRLEQNNEVELLIKTTSDKLQSLIKSIKNLHSYQTPELLYWNVSSSSAYGEWAKEVVSS